jgi:DNA-directed RNA polymerase specialized sigma subunit
MRSTITQSTRSDLLVGYLPLVKASAARVRQHVARQSEFDDLVAAGVFALHDAASTRSLNQPVRFTIYAKQRIRGAMLDSLKKQRQANGRLLSLKSQNAALESASNAGGAPHPASRDDEFGTALSCLQRALAAGGRSGQNTTGESATETAPTRKREGGDR